MSASLRIASSYGAFRTPRSVMIAVTYLAGVTSKAGFSIFTPSGVICFPAKCVTSRVGRIEINGRERCRNVKRYAVFLREHGDRVGADLVGDITIRRDAVCADHDG